MFVTHKRFAVLFLLSCCVNSLIFQTEDLNYTGIGKRLSNRPFPSSKKSHFQSEAKCEAIVMKMIFNYDANKTHFHNKGFALSLVLKVRFFGTQKWPIRSTMAGYEALAEEFKPIRNKEMFKMNMN